MNICILGAGSIGCFSGLLLADGVSASKRDDCDRIVLLGRRRLQLRFQNGGFSFRPGNADESARLGEAEGTLYFETDYRALASADIVLLCVKSADTRSCAAILAEHAPDTAIVVSLHGLASASRGPSINVSNDILAVQWSKLLMNLNNSVNALSGLTLRPMLLNRQYRLVLASAIDEAVAVLKSAKQPLVRIGKVHPRALPFLLRLPNFAFRLVARSTLNIRETASSSMQDDLKNGRLTEVDYINGKIVDAAHAMGMKAPVNQKLTELVHQAEKAGSGSPRLTAEALMEQIRPAEQR